MDAMQVNPLDVSLLDMNKEELHELIAAYMKKRNGNGTLVPLILALEMFTKTNIMGEKIQLLDIIDRICARF